MRLPKQWIFALSLAVAFAFSNVVDAQSSQPNQSQNHSDHFIGLLTPFLSGDALGRLAASFSSVVFFMVVVALGLF